MNEIILIASILFLNPVLSHAEALKSLSGEIRLSKAIETEIKEGGALFIFAKKKSDADIKGVPPLAVLRIPNPKFPVFFSLSQENAMMAGTPFEGPFVVTARYSPSGDALDKTGPEGRSASKKILQLGAKNIVITLKKK